MKERPILFSAPMVRALLDGSKTQTRRIVKKHRSDDAFCLVDHGDGWWPHRSNDGETPNVDGMEYPFACPYGQPRDRLYVRETWRDDYLRHEDPAHDSHIGYLYRADLDEKDDKTNPWKPSIHMPKAASRIQLEIESVRVERLNDCSEADAIAEGCAINNNGYYWGGPHPESGTKQMATARKAYRDLWESINGAGSWAANPWVWVVEFKRVAP